MAEETDLRRLLILHGPSLESQGIISLLGECFQVKVVQELDHALTEMRSEAYDAVLAETADFLPLERGIVTQQAAVVLDTIGDGVCIVGPGGELVWANRRIRELPPDVTDRLRGACAAALGQFAGAGLTDSDRGKRFSIMPQDGAYYEVICSPVRDRQGVARQVAAVVVNATRQRRQQLKLNAIDRAGRELVRLDDSGCGSDATGRLKMLQERIIRYISDVLDYQHFTVLLLDGRTNRLEPLISEGLGEKAQRYEMFALPDGSGICGYVAAVGRSYVCPDVARDSRYLPGMPNARSSLTVPLRLHDKVIGVLNVESDRPGAFGEEDRQFAEIFANYVAVALHMLNLLAWERNNAHTDLTGSISAELAGPLNDIITEAGDVIEDYIGHDDLRKRLGAIVDLATKARRTLQQFSDAPSRGMLGASGPATQADPVLAGKKVLIADDEDLIRQTISDVLCGCGCSVDVARDGAAAKELIAAGNYHLVISDIKMPGASGYEVFAAAKQANSQTQVILITAFGYDPHHSIVRANRQGLSAVLTKPFKVRQLLDECRSALSAVK